MNLLDQKQLLYLKNNHFNKHQKTYCKKFEQTGANSFTFKVEGVRYTLEYSQSKAYTNFVFDNLLTLTNKMSRGQGPLKQDNYGKINYTEENTIRKLDKKMKNENK
jgi:hypothetical protein